GRAAGGCERLTTGFACDDHRGTCLCINRPSSRCPRLGPFVRHGRARERGRAARGDSGVLFAGMVVERFDSSPETLMMPMRALAAVLQRKYLNALETITKARFHHAAWRRPCHLAPRGAGAAAGGARGRGPPHSPARRP